LGEGVRPGSTSAPSTGTIVKVTMAATLGTLVDYFDFYLAGFVAASVWPYIFFPTGQPVVAFALSVSAYALTYFMRPIGAFVFGHLGDRRGRQKTLIWTLLTAGVGMVGIGLTPSYATIGYLAPALVSVFRLIFGLGIGGEWGGAMAWVAEFAAKSKWRPFWMSWIQGGAPGGRLIAGVAIVAVASTMSNSTFLAYGWRELFLVGAAILVIAVVIRYKLTESPLFAALAQRKAVDRSPAINVLRLQWRKILLLAGAVNYNITISAFMVLPYSLQYAVALADSRHVAGVTASAVSLAISVGALVDWIIQIVGGMVGSVIGRKRTFLISTVASLIFVFTYFPLFNTLDIAYIFLASALAQGAIGLGYGNVGAFLNEQFETRYRYSGSGLCYQIGSVVSGVTIGIVLPLIIVGTPSIISQWPYVAGLTAALTIVSIICLLFTKETKGIELQ
jgi:MFS family permease